MRIFAINEDGQPAFIDLAELKLLLNDPVPEPEDNYPPIYFDPPNDARDVALDEYVYFTWPEGTTEIKVSEYSEVDSQGMVTKTVTTTRDNKMRARVLEDRKPGTDYRISAAGTAKDPNGVVRKWKVGSLIKTGA